MKTFVDKCRGTTSTDETRMARQTIDRYLPDFQNHYQYEKQKIPGLQSNLFQYEGCSLCTNYLNNIQTRLTTHLHKTINCMLHVAEHRQQLRDSQTPEIFKSDIRHFLRDVSYFKYDIVDKILYHQIVVGDDEEVSEVILELRDMGVEFVEVLRSLANVLKAADHRDWVKNSLRLDIERRPEFRLATMYELSQVNEQMGFRIFQPFPLKRSFIPSFIPLDLGVVSSHISDSNDTTLKQHCQDVTGFWDGIFKTEHKVFTQANKRYTGSWMMTDGYSLCVLWKNNGARTQPHARKRKRGESADDRRARTYRNIPKVP